MDEWSIKEYLMAIEDLLPPLQRDTVDVTLSPRDQADAFLTLRWRGDLPTDFYNFLVEIKSQNTPRIVHQAITQIQAYTRDRNDPDMHPMIVVPYLSEERLAELEQARVSGIDLCGNGIVTIPGRVLVYRTGNENRYPATRPVSNPYQGKSGVVGRIFLSYEYATVLDADENRVRETGRQTSALSEIWEAILKRGVDISLSQVSKTVSALEEERILGSQGRAIYLLDPDLLLDRLASAWPRPPKERTYLKLPGGRSSLSRLIWDENGTDSNKKFKWAITGESSVAHHLAFAQGGPLQVAVSNLRKAKEWLQGEEESIPNFADVTLLESDEPGYYFDNDVDENGLRWASVLQTWIELANGDGRQKDAAREILDLIIPQSPG
jgi:hypothetical protein